ncbi:UNC79 family protein [Megaselia abdita]
MTGSFKNAIINMGTRSAAFQSKLRNLHEYHLRLLHNVPPAPSGIDIANTIKYFSQTLLTVLKDVPTSPHQLIRDTTLDSSRMSAYPNLEYGNLYNALTMLIDVAPLIAYGQSEFGKALLHCLCCILPFLDKDLIDNLPYLTSSTISVLPSGLHQDIVNALCYYVLPFTITRKTLDDQESQACQSVSAVIMMVFQYTNNTTHHCQLVECLMRLKCNVVKDILCIIAYGTAQSRSSAAKLLFYYWPAFDPNLFDRRCLLSKLTTESVTFVCQRDHCPNAGNAEAIKICFDHSISINYAPESPPPLYLCIECANEIHREHNDLPFSDILHPMQQVSMICENKNCRSDEKSAFSICFSSECASYNGNHPIRYCVTCHNNRHNNRRGFDHVVHRSLPPAWQMDPEMQMHMIESVVSLLRESKPMNFDPGKDSSSVASAVAESKASPNGIHENMSLEERQLLGRYGIWLLVGRCTPTSDTPLETLGRLLGMLFHWFHVTAYSYDASSLVESTIEKLKIEHVCPWLKDICEKHHETFISCLLPHPPIRVGGYWETLASRTSHLKEGLQRLFCLVPYEVITSEIWDYIMPHWMEAITNDVGERELCELKIVLSKILDPDMSPLGFDARTMYNFVAIRFEKTTAKVQQQALHWLQILTKLEILIPLTQLFAMFGDGVRIMKCGVQHEMMMKEKGGKIKDSKEKIDVAAPPRRSSISPVVEDDSGNTSAMSDDEAPTARHTEFSTDAEHNLTCCILMLDILLRQMELQDVEQHLGIHTSVSENVCRLLKCMVTAARVGLSSHVCSVKQVADCPYCEASIMWHQLSTKLVQFMAPESPIRPPDPPIVQVIEDEKSSRKSPPDNDKDKSRERDMCLSMAPLPIPLGPLGGFADDPGKILIMAGPVQVAVPQPEPHSVGGVLVHMPHVCSSITRGRIHRLERHKHVHASEIMTATVETVSEQLDLASIMPSDKVGSAVARSVTVSEADVANATAQSAKPVIVGTTESDIAESLNESDGEDGEDIWHTSVGKFRFTLDLLPQPLQYIHQILTEIPTVQKSDILYYMIQCLNVMALHGDALTKAARDQRGFFIWCQENLLIKNLWELCNAEHSHICQFGVPLLLHCITLPLGSDVFWRVVQEDFHHVDWRVRFTAVERVTVIARFMDSTPLRTEVGLQTALATAFCHLIAMMDDISVYVAQRSTLYLGTIHDNAIRSLLFCLESQFDLFIVDRPVVLQSIYQLHNSLSDRKILTWDFFLNRFDTLFVEAQITLEKSGELAYLRDLRNSENGSETLSTKISKAREALSQSDSTGMAKTLSASFGTKWPYKRTMSAPASIIPRQDSNKLDGHFHSIGGVPEENLASIIHRIVEIEQSDKETIHLLVFLLMQFMSRQDQAYPVEGPSGKPQNIVIKHLFLLLGYNQLDKTFHTTAMKLRASATFNAFISSLPQVLDQNPLIGSVILPSALHILLFAPNTNWVTSEVGTNHNYSLWFLEVNVRRNWLMAILVVLYKYVYVEPPLNVYINGVIKIIINSLKAQFHQCRRLPTTTVLDIPMPSRSRDISQTSLKMDIDTSNARSPPASPFIAEGPSDIRMRKFPQKSHLKTYDVTLENDDTETELGPIPESEVPESTAHITPFVEMMAPLKKDMFQCKPSTSKKFKTKSQPTSSKSEDFSLSKTFSKALKKKGIQDIPMMIMPSMCLAENEAKEKAVLNPPADVQKAVTVTQFIKSKSLEAKPVVEVPKVEVTLPSAQPFPSSNILGNQKRIIGSSPTEFGKKRISSNEIITCGSPESPLSRMNVLHMPSEDGDETDSLLSPNLISHMDFPVPERLLPIGQCDTVAQIVDKVREELKLPDISHLKDDSLDKSDELSTSSRAQSPRRLTKQVALDTMKTPPEEQGHSTREGKFLQRQRPKLKKVGPLAADSQVEPDSRKYVGSWAPPSLDPNDGNGDDIVEGKGIHLKIDNKNSQLRIGDETILYRCDDCGSQLEEYNDEEIGIMIITLGTFIHREPSSAALFLPEIMMTISNFALRAPYPWQNENNTHLPGSSQSVALQFIRCVVHQLAPNGIFMQIFQTEVHGACRYKYLKSIAKSLSDFQELNPIRPIHMVCETLTSKKTLPVEKMPIILRNMAEYLAYIPVDISIGQQQWSSAMQALTTLFQQIVVILPVLDSVEYLLELMIAALKLPCITKAILEPFSKVLSFCIQNINLKHKVIFDICTLSMKAYTRDRDKMYLCRTIIFEFVQALKFKNVLPDYNLLLIIGFTLQDAGGSLPPHVLEDFPHKGTHGITNAGDCMRQYLNDIVDFLADFHSLSKLKNFKGNIVGENSLGGILKGSVAQYLALDMSRGNNRETKAISRYLPWLYNAPSSLQQGQKEFTECVGHIRILSWLLVGCLTHLAVSQRKINKIGHHRDSTNPSNAQVCQPVPQEASCHIADHIQNIFAGFKDQSKASVVHMSSLFHAFTLCQLWTVYLEQISLTFPPNSEQHNVTMGILFEFWTKVTPTILQLVSQSPIQTAESNKETGEFLQPQHQRKLSEMVNLHFITLLEGLKDIHSTVLPKFLPIWSPVLASGQLLSDTLHLRLQSVRDLEPKLNESSSDALLDWLQKLQFKISKNELQSSTATQFFNS